MRLFQSIGVVQQCVQVILFCNLNAKKLVFMVIVYHLVRVNDSNTETPLIQSAFVVSKLPQVFLNQFLRVHLDKEKDFSLDIPPDTRSISILRYRMSPTDLKEFKEKLTHLFERGLFMEFMKNDIEEFVAKCMGFQKVQVEHKRPCGMAQNIENLVWNQDMTNKDFTTCFLWSRRQHDSICVIEEEMNKSTHFLPIKTTHSSEDCANLYI